MSFFDIVLFVFLVYGLYKGIRNGLFVELASLISFIVGVYIAIKFSSVVANRIGDGTSKSLKVIAFVLTLIMVIIAIHLMAKVFTKIADFAFLGWLNHLLGGFIGIFRMIIFLGICIHIINKISDTFIEKETKEHSLFYDPVIKTSELIFPILEKEFEDLKKESTSTL